MEGPMEQTLVELMKSDAEAARFDPEVANRLRNMLPRKPSELSEKELAHAIARGLCLRPLVQRLLDIVEADPLASAGWFSGDLLRSLIDVPEWFWRQNAESDRRYRDALRAGATARRNLPMDQRMEFWSAIPDIES
jgi:hypothetical protein